MARRVTQPAATDTTIEDAGRTLRIVDGRVCVELDLGGGSWVPLTRAEMLELTNRTWLWLRQRGIRRPSPSGPSGPTTPEGQRGTVQVLVRLAPDVAERLRDLAERRRVTLGALVTGWLAAEREP
jgi:hypothetical protein